MFINPRRQRLAEPLAMLALLVERRRRTDG
jgi:hypothetical protein